MTINLVSPVAVPARTYDRYGLQAFELHVRADGSVDVAAIAQQSNATDWSDNPATRVHLREPNLITAIGRSSDPATAAAQLAAVTDGLLYFLGMLLSEQSPGSVVFPPEN